MVSKNSKLVCMFCMLAFSMLLSSCAGFRSGIESLAYIENPDNLPARRGPGYIPPHVVKWQDMELAVRLNNRLQTNDYTVMLIVVPTSVDPFDKPAEGEGGRLVVYLDVKSASPGRIFEPAQVRFMLDDKAYLPVKVSEDGRWNEKGEADNEQGKWRYQDLSGGRSLTDARKQYAFRLEFDMVPPSPKQQNLQLDLGKAFHTPAGVEGPVLKFKPVHWEQGYT